jgi:hypothetical protein
LAMKHARGCREQMCFQAIYQSGTHDLQKPTHFEMAPWIAHDAKCCG